MDTERERCGGLVLTQVGEWQDSDGAPDPDVLSRFAKERLLNQEVDDGEREHDDDGLVQLARQ